MDSQPLPCCPFPPDHELQRVVECIHCGYYSRCTVAKQEQLSLLLAGGQPPAAPFTCTTRTSNDFKAEPPAFPAPLSPDEISGFEI